MRELFRHAGLVLTPLLFAGAASAQCQRLVIHPFGNNLERCSALEADGDWLVAGFPSADGPLPGETYAGIVFVMRREANGDFATELVLSGSDGDHLGQSVAIELPALAFGAPDEPVSGGGTGKAYVYELDGAGTWVLDGAFNPGSTADVGSGVALHGEWAWAGSDGDLGVRLHRDPGGWVVDGTEPIAGSQVAMDSTHLIFTGGDQTHAYELAGGTWSLVQTLPKGRGARIDGDRAVVIHENDLLRIYEWNGAQWIQTFEIDASDHFLHLPDVALSDDLLVFGQHSLELGMWSGRALVYRREGATWKFLTALIPDGDADGTAFTQFGSAVAIMGTEILVGAQYRIVVHELPTWLSTFCHCDAPPCGNADRVRGCANSTGWGASLTVCGSASVSADDLTLTASLLPPGQSGLIYMGAGQINLPFGDGQRCVGAGGIGTFRFSVQSADADGRFVEGPGIVAHSQGFPSGGEIDAGETWHFQAWYRDPGGPCGSTFNLSHGVSIPFGP